MDPPRLYDEISRLIALLSLISKRFTDLGQTDDAPGSPKPDSTSSPSGQPEVDDDEEAHPDEVEFESEVISEEAAADGALKKRALDRLAEVFSRFKTDKNSQGRVNNGNLDAKHVASVALVEDLERGRATLFVP